MNGATRIFNVTSAGSRRAASAYRVAVSQPGWVTRIALLTFLLILAVPILLVLMLAASAALVVFLVLAAANALGSFVRGWLPRSDGRANVRIIRRDEP